jgi:hypothetical protein
VAGLAIGLAAHTRFEGWFLFLPLFGWTTIKAVRGHLVEPSRASASNTNPKCQRGVKDAVPRWRFGLISAAVRPIGKPIGGVLLSIAIAPLLILVVNVTLLRDLPRWELGNFERVGYVAQWWQAKCYTAQAPAAHAPEQVAIDAAANFPQSPAPLAGAAPASDARMAVSKMFQLYGNALRRGFGALFGLAWIVGFVVNRQRLFRADHAILFLLAAVIGAAAWFHLWYGQATSSRYFLAIVILACPCSALGACYVYERLLGLFNFRFTAHWHQAALKIAFMVTVLASGVAESIADQHDGRTRDAALGRWLLAEFGPQSAIATIGSMPVVGFYAQTTPKVLLPGDIEALRHHVDAVIAVEREKERGSMLAMIDCLRDRGYQKVDLGRLPDGYGWNDLVVLKYGRTPMADRELAAGERRPVE